MTAGAEEGVRPVLTLTAAAAAKWVAAFAFMTATLYFLHTGRRDRDVDRLFWAAVCGLLTGLIAAI